MYTCHRVAFEGLLWRFYDWFVFFVRPISLSSIIPELKEQLKPDYIEVQVRREHVLEDLLKEARRSSFDSLKQIKVNIY